MAKRGNVARLEATSIKADLEIQLDAANKARGDKLTQSVEFLKSQLEIAEKKYLTVNGYMQARSTYEQALFGEEGFEAELPAKANLQARGMASIVKGLAKKLDKTHVDDLDESFLDGLLIEDFALVERTIDEVVQQLLVINLLQNIGPAIDDIVSFRVSTDEGIAVLQTELLNHADPRDAIPGQMTVQELDV